MRIAQIAPRNERVPPKLYDGTERIVSYLTEPTRQVSPCGRQDVSFRFGE